MLGLPADKPIECQEGYVDPRMRQDPSGFERVTGLLARLDASEPLCHVGGLQEQGKLPGESKKSVKWGLRLKLLLISGGVGNNNLDRLKNHNNNNKPTAFTN